MQSKIYKKLIFLFKKFTLFYFSLNKNFSTQKKKKEKEFIDFSKFKI
jgi:hypothetical protein